MTLATTSPTLPKLNFPTKLHLILSSPEYNDLICWLPHGRAWRVQQQDRFETEVLPKFFHHQKFSSFARQVTGWGFNRIPTGRDFNAYYHELFLRDAPELCRKMKRPSRTELAERKQALPHTPPDFYLMPPVSDDIVNASATDPTSMPAMTIDEYKETLIRRLSTYSLTEKGMYLQLELNKLGKRRIHILKELQGLRSSNPSPPLRANNPLTAIPLSQRPIPHVQIPQQIQPQILPQSLANNAQQGPAVLRDDELRDRIQELLTKGRHHEL